MSSASVDLTPQVTLSRCVPVSSATSTQSTQHPQEAPQSQVGETLGNQRLHGAGQALVAGAPDGDAVGAEAVVACDVGEGHAEVAQPEGPASHSPLSTKLAMAAMSGAQRDGLVARRLRVI